MDQHLTVREACDYTTKSESTIKRLIREITSVAEHPERGAILPPPDEVERRRKAGDGFSWKLNRDLLDRRFPKASPFQQGTVDKKHSPPGDDTQSIIHVLREQLQSKDRQLQTLETQLDRKDDQIKNLSDRMHESNVLMRELQSRLSIAAPKPTQDDKKLSAIDAAAKLLAETKEPMNCKQMIEGIAAKGYWTSPGGKTPHATLYSAIIREISVKGNEARFTKTERGNFAAK